MAKLPLNLAKSLKALKEASASAAESASITLAGEQALVERARERFAAGGTVPSTYVGPLSGRAGAAPSRGEVLVIRDHAREGGGGRGLPRRRGRQGVGHSRGGRGTRDDGTRPATCPGGIVRLSFSDSDAGWDRLFSLCAEAAGDQGMALGRRYPVVRRAAAHRLIRQDRRAERLHSPRVLHARLRHAGHDAQPGEDGPQHRGHVRPADRQGAGGRTGGHGGAGLRLPGSRQAPGSLRSRARRWS